MTYRTYFDAAQNGLSQNGYAAWFGLAVGLVCILFGAGIVIGWPYSSRSRWVGQRSRFIDGLGLGFAVLLTLYVFAATFSAYRDAASKLRERKYAVVEGFVTDFSELPKGNQQKSESFVVGGRRFTYSGYELFTAGGFNQMASQGGPIHEGLYVRVTYSGSEILRLEIAQ
ncbi:hypothetical protein [Rhodoblastus sp.]|uniref:hypothetical protein n=1 Tax=Rhodoblastus sp. TaxID=1962975 RepID=UPI003F99C8A6